jgi:hypothetical protein
MDMATAFRALRNGVGRVRRAPALLLGLWMVTLLMALPPGLAVESAIRGHLGSSREAEAAVAGVNTEWWQEFGEGARGLAASFTPNVIGGAAALDNLSRFLDNGSLPSPVFWLAAAYLALWLFLGGGVLDRLARDRPTRSTGFFAACGTYFPRFVRLGVVSGLVYWFLFGPLHRWLFVDLYGRAIRDLTVERTAFYVNAGLYVAFALLLVACNVVFDYARIRMVVEDRRSMLGGLLASLRFIRRHAGAVIGLVLAHGVCFAAVFAAYVLAAPGAGSIWIAFMAGQAYLVARLFVKLAFMAAGTALFQSLLAHDAYTAAPPLVWPESPAVESILNAVRKAEIGRP